MAGGGLATSIVVFAVGAVLRFALTVSEYQHGFNVHMVGVILMIVGAVGAVLSLIAIDEYGNGKASNGHRRRSGQRCPPRRYLH